ncbi:hypothetical protein PIB30_084028 [Stylosanthes scabra]|uniref:Uncharacterized protein n=1 Tax=Stylosanthes scabra TaxID=79078 RepID=A0ABU6QTP9_9FABA|nr:hypothetical protein [Stylosanthes scabra]
MGVIPSHKYPPLFSDPDDDDTASGPPDLREQVTLLNREISQQAEAHAQSLATVEAACAEKVRTLESTVQTQSQEVSDLRRAYSDMYSFLTQNAEWRIRLSGAVGNNYRRNLRSRKITDGLAVDNSNLPTAWPSVRPSVKLTYLVVVSDDFESNSPVTYAKEPCEPETIPSLPNDNDMVALVRKDLLPEILSMAPKVCAKQRYEEEDEREAEYMEDESQGDEYMEDESQDGHMEDVDDET